MAPRLLRAIALSLVLPGWLGAQRDAARDGAWARSALTRLTLRQRVGLGQMARPRGYADYTAASDSAWSRLSGGITADQVGDCTMSIGRPMEMAAVLNAMQAMAGVPLLIGADLEAGPGFRASGGFFLPNAIDLSGVTLLPPLRALGATRDTGLAYATGKATAVEGRAHGIHSVYGPVPDVNRNAANPAVDVRNVGEDPTWVRRLVASFIRGVQDSGMLATGKHFSGHGDTDVNSYLALPVVTTSRARLDSVELRPFRSRIAAGVGAAMTFHGSMPALDSTGTPGALSVAVHNGLRRREMAFTGLIISDAMAQFGLQRNAQLDSARVRRVVGDSTNKRLSERVAVRAIALECDSLKLLPLLGTTPTPD